VSHASYETHAPLIEDLLRWIARRYRLDPDAAQEFASEARVKLLADGCRILDEHHGRSSMRTYLSVVLLNHFRDWRNREWGRWRPSVAARREGEVAVALERLLVRDGLTFDQAAQALASGGCAASREELYELSRRFPVRDRRLPVGEEVLDGLPSQDTAEGLLLAAERRDVGSRLASVLAEAIAGLPAQHRLMLKLRFEDNRRLKDIARALHVPERQLYHRFAQMLRTLRQAIEAKGLDSDSVAGDHRKDLFDLDSLLEDGGRGPSIR
jgi:RNA polymerase sigma factor (sigma-70 family)